MLQFPDYRMPFEVQCCKEVPITVKLIVSV